VSKSTVSAVFAVFADVFFRRARFQPRKRAPQIRKNREIRDFRSAEIAPSEVEGQKPHFPE